MSILNYERSQIVALSPLIRGDAVRWYDVCKALKEGMTQERIAEMFNLCDDRAVRKIKEKHCPECGRPH